MRTIVILVAASLSLAACAGTPKQPTAELQALQDKCGAGDMNACSDLAHAVKAQ